jgi:S1-C subfamily serine protease
VISQVNGQSVKQADDVQQAVENTGVGSELEIGLRRNGQNVNLKVRTGSFPAASAR